MCRGPSELVQYFADRGNSHRRKGNASHIIDMVWLYRSSIPVLCKKKVSNFPVPSRDVTNQTLLAGNNFIILFNLIDGKIANLFYSVGRRGYFTRSKDFYLPLRRLEVKGFGASQHPVEKTRK
jgi:hypothetical protein